jgi:release factor glutamine methyltransferase
VTFYDAAIQARARLQEAGISPDTATRDADLLARHALGWDLATWLARRREPASSAFLDTYDAIIRRRVNREPVAYIRGVQEFWGRDFRVATGVLIPRPETELLIELAGDYLRDHPGAAIIDVGTGSGCIAITLALEHPAATVHATDISSAALAIAAANASRLGAKVNFIQASLLDSAPRPMNLIVSNPPYVAERDKPGLSREVRDYEPDVALYGGTDGWREIRALLRATPTVLADDGLLLMELGYGQSEQLANEVEQVDSLFVDHIHADLQGIPRVAVIRRRRSDASATE